MTERDEQTNVAASAAEQPTVCLDGPDDRGDGRLYLSRRDMLELLLLTEQAESSATALELAALREFKIAEVRKQAERQYAVDIARNNDFRARAAVRNRDCVKRLDALRNALSSAYSVDFQNAGWDDETGLIHPSDEG